MLQLMLQVLRPQHLAELLLVDTLCINCEDEVCLHIYDLYIYSCVYKNIDIYIYI